MAGHKIEKDDQFKVYERLKNKIQKKSRHLGLLGESDRKIPSEMPKHLYSGKRKLGKLDRR